MPEQRGPADLPPYQDGAYPEAGYRTAGPETGWPAGAPPGGPALRPPGRTARWPAAGSRPRPEGGASDGEGPGQRRAGARLRVDARRNLESVLRAAREVFGEFGYDAPMEEVARPGRGGCRHGVPALPQQGGARPADRLGGGRLADHAGPRVALRRRRPLGVAGRLPGAGGGVRRGPAAAPGGLPVRGGAGPGAGTARCAGPGHRSVARPDSDGDPAPGASGSTTDTPDADPRLLLQLLAALVARAGAAGELRPGVTVSDVVLVLTASVPVHAAQAAPAAAGRGIEDLGTDGWGSEVRTRRVNSVRPATRLLEILLDGLRAR